MKYVGERMIADTDDVDGNVHFNMETFDFYPHHSNTPIYSFRYTDIKKLESSRPFIKACITITFFDGHIFNLYTYRPATLLELLKSGIAACKEGVVDVDLTEEDNNKQDDQIIEKLTKLNELYKQGVITEEEFNTIKSRLINK